MRIIFDAYWWVHGPPSLRHTLREIVLAWHAVFPDDELTLVARSKDAVEASWEVPLGIDLEFSSHWPQALLATRAVARAAASTNADAVITHNFAAKVPCVSAMYLHDVLFRTNPEWFTPLERMYFSFMTRWVQRADIVFTSSKTEANRISAESDARLVLPVGLGLSTELTADRAEIDPDESLRAGSFILAVGRLNTRKNLERTIMGALESGLVTKESPIVVVGEPDGKLASFSRVVAKAKADGLVRFTGYVSDARLRWLYGNARLFTFLSLGEGFGMPPIEAAHFGAPILVSDLPVFHENLGDRADYVDPTDVAAIAAAMRAAVGHAPAASIESIGERHDWSDTVRSMRSAIVEQNRLAAA